MADRRGQILLATSLIIAILLLSVVVMIYEARLVYLKTRSIVIREAIASITADFKRALTHVLSLATRAYFNYTRYEKMLSKYKEEGLTLYNKHNFTVARQIGIKYLELWKTFITEAYVGYGVQVSIESAERNLTRILGRPRFLKYGDLMKAFWYYPSSCSIIDAYLLLNLSNAGFYGWRSEVTVGLVLTIYPDYNASLEGNWTSIHIGVLYDSEVPYPYLTTRGRIEVYIPREAYWALAKIINITYIGNGEYIIQFKPYIEPLYDSLEDREYVPVLVVIEDHRGIVVEACSYTHIAFGIKRRIPTSLTAGSSKITRPSNTAHEVYTLEFTWDLNIYWLGIQLEKENNLKLPPIPFMPIKQLRVNVTSDGTLETLKKRPVQYEEWRRVTWHGYKIWIPESLSDPQMDFSPKTRLVFQVKFPYLNVVKQLVTIWWEDDLDAEPEIYSSLITYIYDDEHKDVRHPLYDVEFIDLEHPQSRGYVNYHGVAALVMRDPVTDYAFGPYNIHAFGIYYSSGRYYLGKYRPYGTWEIYHNYLRYTWIQAPIRIFAVLNTTLVGNVYVENGDPHDDYYDTLIIVQIINDTRYIPILTYIYWKKSHSDYGYWLCMSMGRGLSEWFAYIDKFNSTGNTPFNINEIQTVREEKYPNFMITYWRWQDEKIGRAIVLSRSGVQLLYSTAGSSLLPRFVSTKYGSGGELQGSIEYVFWDYNVYRSVYESTFLSYWTVIFDYNPQGGSGWKEIVDPKNGWINAYIYAPMFLEDYSPIVTP